MAYTTIEEVESYLLLEIDPAFQYQITDWIAFAKEHIDHATNRTFETEAEATPRRFDGTGLSSLRIDECTEVTSIKIDGVEVENESGEDEEYLLYPANATPKREILLARRYFPRGAQNIEVTAKWGYSDTAPRPISFAATVLVAGLINQSNQHDGEVQSETIGRYTVTYRSQKEVGDFETAKDIIKQYRRITF